MEDKLLVYRCKRGSEESLRRIYEKYRDNLLMVAGSLLYDKGLAEDVVQSVFTAFVENIENFTLRTSLKHYLATCTANCARNINRAAMKPRPVPEVSSSSYDPCAGVIFDEQALAVQHAMAQIPEDQRVIILLNVMADVPMREIAKSLKIPVNTVKSRYRYGMDKLRLILKNEVPR